MKSIGISPKQRMAGNNTDNFIDVSSFIYNRHTYDKSIQIFTSEINLIVSIDSIFGNKEKLYQIVSRKIDYLLDKEFLKEIMTLDDKDLKRICNYNVTNKSYSGLEYFILKHLIDSHIKEVIKDIKEEKLNKIIQLKIDNNKKDRDNLIIKVFPNKSRSDNQTSYCISLVYPVL